MAHRSEAQKVAGITAAQHRGLALGSKKGCNYRNGRKDTAETRAKRKTTLIKFHAENPDIAIERGKKTRGENNYRWKGGISKLNLSIRQMTETRRWMEAVKARDGACVRCGSVEALEAHHVRPFAIILNEHGVKSRDDARAHAADVWDISNGETLCEACHYAEHGRIGPPTKRVTAFKICPVCNSRFTVRPSSEADRRCCSLACAITYRRKHPRAKEQNPNWKGGLVKWTCKWCSTVVDVKPSEIKRKSFCSRECCHAHR